VPELPEVETVIRSVAPHVLGQAIKHAEMFSARVTRGGLARTAAALRGTVITKVWRRGKQIFFDLDRGVLYIHLGMTGKLLWEASRGKYTRAVFYLENGILLYDDVRQFGRVEYFRQMPESLEQVGPDALGIGFDEFYERLRRRGGSIKPLLLNQTFICGVGNIYADEALFAACIHPRTSAQRISRNRARELHGCIVEVLRAAIEHRGSSISDYVDTSGNRGSFQNLHSVYGREGKPCLRCGTSIRRIVLGQRGTHYCPRCQHV
jgi:formamidopyrimidine-DNA glycosylase